MPSLRACFIGIDKYEDDSAHELSGAVRDAEALHALFTDSVPGLDAHLLTNEKATHEAVRKALQSTLANASTDDTIIISFAGHGSRSHRLLAHDSRKATFASTSIGMDELAELFRESPAKYILCILDCCFSGGAAARVFDDATILRSLTGPFDGFQGNGRMLFAAAGIGEEALEDSSARHGLFTKALLDVLLEQGDGADLSAVAGMVTDRVRAEAQRRGFNQSPVIVNFTEGGMKLPLLRPGAGYKEAFPDKYARNVGSDLTELETLGVPVALAAAWKTRYTTLNDLQLRAVNEFRVLDGESLVAVAPTSSGKTLIGELAAGRAIVESRKAVFLLPYRALVSEKYDQFDELYGQELGMRVIRCSGDYTDDAGRFLYGKYDLAVCTYEMFLSLAVSNPAVLNQIGLVVLDEAQFITDPNRGITVELLLTLIVAARERAICPQLVALSAVIGDINHFDSWLGCRSLVTYDRPVKLVEGVIDRTGTYQYADEAGVSQTIQFLPHYEIRQRRERPSAQDVIVPLARKLSAEGKKAIVFHNKKGSAQGCANYLAADLGLPRADDALQKLPVSDMSSASRALRQALAGGTAFHTSNLNRDERSIVEQAFRDPKGQVQLLAATTTVAAGINTPASVVIIAEQEFLGENGRPFTVAEYKNMAGRAGRLGYQEDGQAIIYAETPFQRTQLFQKYVKGTVEPMASSFNDQDIHTWVIRLLAQIRMVRRNEVATLIASTFGGYLRNRQRPDWAATMRTRVEEIVTEMITYGLIEVEGELVSLTLLGRACGGSSLSYASSLRLIRILRSFSPDAMTPEGLMALVQGLEEGDAIYTPLQKGPKEQGIIAVAATRFGRLVVVQLQQFVADSLAHARRCKRACILADWIAGASYDDIETQYTSNPFYAIGPGEIRSIAETTRYHLRSACQILRVIYVDQGPTDESLEVLLKRVEFGIAGEALGLVELPVPLLRGDYMALFKAGIVDKDTAVAAPEGLIASVIGNTLAHRILAALTAS